MTTASSSTGIPSYAFPPTTAPVISAWYEVAASFDARTDLPRLMAVGAVNDLDEPLPFITATSIEVQLPSGAAVPLDFGIVTNFQLIQMPVKWRINKPETLYPVSYVVFGTGMTVTATD